MRAITTEVPVDAAAPRRARASETTKETMRARVRVARARCGTTNARDGARDVAARAGRRVEVRVISRDRARARRPAERRGKGDRRRGGARRWWWVEG